MSEKDSNVTFALVEASNLLRDMAAPHGGKRALQIISRKLPWSYRHIKAVWYREQSTVVDADEMQQLRRAARLAKEEQEATDELAQLRNGIARIKDRLMRIDPEFHCEDAAALVVASSDGKRKDGGPERLD